MRWDDEGLKRYSESVIDAYRPYRPELPALVCRAEVLAACPVPGRVEWKVGPRTAEELRQAAALYEQAAAQAADEKERMMHLGNAGECLRRAQATIEKFGEGVQCFTLPTSNADGGLGASAVETELWERTLREAESMAENASEDSKASASARAVDVSGLETPLMQLDLKSTAGQPKPMEAVIEEA